MQSCLMSMIHISNLKYTHKIMYIEKIFCIFFPCRLAHVGGILNGTAGVGVCVIPSVISALWFPPGQRTLSTST